MSIVRSRKLKIGCGILLVPILIYFFNPAWGCGDFVSGRVPRGVGETFIEMIINASLTEDYAWLNNVSSDEALEDILEFRDVFSPIYSLRLIDDLAGGYRYLVAFDGGAELVFQTFSAWPTCPDFNVTQAEIEENMQLRGIYE